MARTASAQPKSLVRPYGRGSGVPNPVDVHVGKRIRIRRLLLGMHQAVLGEALNLTFQQIQKYESGANRVSASRLLEIAKLLDVPVSFFFNEMNPEDTQLLDHRMGKSETMKLIRHYYAIPDPQVRRNFLEMVKAAATGSEPPRDGRPRVRCR